MVNAAVKHLHAAAAASSSIFDIVFVSSKDTKRKLIFCSSSFVLEKKKEEAEDDWIYNFITDSIFYTFANCFKRPINNMCNLWVSSLNHNISNHQIKLATTAAADAVYIFVFVFCGIPCIQSTNIHCIWLFVFKWNFVLIHLIQCLQQEKTRRTLKCILYHENKRNKNEN